MSLSRLNVIVFPLPTLDNPPPPARVNVSLSKSIVRLPPLSPAIVKSSSVSNASNVVILVLNEELGEVKEPLIWSANCAEALTKVFSNSDSTLVTRVDKLELTEVNEPLI